MSVGTLLGTPGGRRAVPPGHPPDAAPCQAVGAGPRLRPPPPLSVAARTSRRVEDAARRAGRRDPRRPAGGCGAPASAHAAPGGRCSRSSPWSTASCSPSNRSPPSPPASATGVDVMAGRTARSSSCSPPCSVATRSIDEGPPPQRREGRRRERAVGGARRYGRSARRPRSRLLVAVATDLVFRLPGEELLDAPVRPRAAPRPTCSPTVDRPSTGASAPATPSRSRSSSRSSTRPGDERLPRAESSDGALAPGRCHALGMGDLRPPRSRRPRHRLPRGRPGTRSAPGHHGASASSAGRATIPLPATRGVVTTPMRALTG